MQPAGELTIRIGGEAGMGLESGGVGFAKAIVRGGLHLSRIRGGHNADFPFRMKAVPDALPRLLLNGNRAFAMGALAGGCRFLSDKTAAFERALEWGDRIPGGVFYQVEDRPAYEERVPALKRSPLARRPLEKLRPEQIQRLPAGVF